MSVNMSETYEPEVFNADDYMPVSKEASVPTAQAQAMIGQFAQEVQMAMYVAKNFPRDEVAAFKRIMNAFSRMKLAESAMYEYKRGKTKVNGPSIRSAEAIAQGWGNIKFGFVELEQKRGESQVMAYAWDLETNARQERVFAVKHEREANGSVTSLSGPREINEMVASQAQRRVRACILGVIPGDIVEAAIERAKKTLKEGYKEPLQDRIRKMVVAFDKNFQVSQAMLEKYIGCSADAFSDNDYIRLVGVFRSMKDGMSTREENFDIRVGHEATSDAAEEFKQRQQQQTKGKRGQQPEQTQVEPEVSDNGNSGTEPDDIPTDVGTLGL